MDLYACIGDTETTNGQMLNGGSVYVHQTSCRAMTGNAGNWYSWYTAVARNVINDPQNSICSEGWRIPTQIQSDNKSFYYLMYNIYNIVDNNDDKIRQLPLSFARTGIYPTTSDFSKTTRADNGSFIMSTRDNAGYVYYLIAGENKLNFQGHNTTTDGHSIRCVAR